jgi:glutathione S-transferase
MIFYGSTGSGHSFKVRSFLLQAGIAHDYRWVDLSLPRPDRAPDFVAASQFGEVPVLIDEGRALCQSNAILIYLAQTYGQFCGPAQSWQSVLEWLSWESNRVGFSVPNLRYALRHVAQPPDVLAYLERRAISDLAVLDAVLAKSEFLACAQPTIADISCSAYLFWLDQAGLSVAAYPHIARWLSALSSGPGWAHPDIALS